MATYPKIEKRIRKKHGWVAKNCWIAHCKELAGLNPGKAWNRRGERQIPCPEDKQEAIFEAFRYCVMIPAS